MEEPRPSGHEPTPLSERLVEEDAAADLPGYRNYLVFCDESGMHKSPFYGFGSFWIPAEARGRLHGAVRALRSARKLAPDEIKWSKINRGNRDFYCDLVRMFFERRWMMFHCLVVKKSYVNLALHGGSFDLARQKHFTKLLETKIGLFARSEREKAYHVRVDPLPSSYDKADEVAHKIANSVLSNTTGNPAIKTFETRDSKCTLGIQLADVLIGAVMSDVNGDCPGEHKVAVKRLVAQHLGWPDLHADTRHWQWKFNIWSFHDPKGGQKRVLGTRDVKLLLPMPKWKPRL